MVRESPEHKDIKQTLCELGKELGYIPKPEYNPPRVKEPLDVVWLPVRKQGAVPRAVFEAQVRGELDKAFRKLRDAADRWNCSIHIVATREHVADVRARFEASYSDLFEKLTIVALEDLKDTLEKLRRAKVSIEEVRQWLVERRIPWPERLG